MLQLSVICTVWWNHNKTIIIIIKDSRAYSKRACSQTNLCSPKWEIVQSKKHKVEDIIVQLSKSILITSLRSSLLNRPPMTWMTRNPTKQPWCSVLTLQDTGKESNLPLSSNVQTLNCCQFRGECQLQGVRLPDPWTGALPWTPLGTCPLIHPNYFSVYLGLGLRLGLGLELGLGLGLRLGLGLGLIQWQKRIIRSEN